MVLVDVVVSPWGCPMQLSQLNLPVRRTIEWDRPTLIQTEVGWGSPRLFASVRAAVCSHFGVFAGNVSDC
jgi:hypothetical protein